MKISGVLVTRGNVDIEPVLSSWPAGWERVVWNNAERSDLAVYGRYAAINEASGDLIFVQDDDCVLNPESLDALLAAYEPGYIVANMPQRFRHDFYEEHCLVGFGAIFDRDLVARAFTRYNGIRVDEQDFLRAADILFTALTPRILLDLPYTDREFASAPNRMWTTPGHLEERTRMLALARKVRDA